MKKTSTREIPGLIVVEKAQLNSALELVEKVRKTNGINERPVQDDASKIIVKLRSGDRHSPTTVDDVYCVPNVKSDPIETIELGGGSFSKNRATIELGGHSYSRTAAKLEVSGTTDVVNDAISDFEQIFRREKDISETILSLKPFVLAIMISCVVHFLAGAFSLSFFNILNREPVLIFGYLVIFWMGPVMFLSFAIDYSLYRLIGRAVFDWSDGKIRYEKRKKIITFVFWTVPFAIVIRIVTSYLGS